MDSPRRELIVGGMNCMINVRHLSRRGQNYKIVMESFNRDQPVSRLLKLYARLFSSITIITSIGNGLHIFQYDSNQCYKYSIKWNKILNS